MTTTEHGVAGKETVVPSPFQSMAGSCTNHAINVPEEGEEETINLEKEEEDEEDPLGLAAFQKKKRKRTSKVWDEFTEIVVSGIKKAEYKYCKKSPYNIQGRGYLTLLKAPR